MNNIDPDHIKINLPAESAAAKLKNSEGNKKLRVGLVTTGGESEDLYSDDCSRGWRRNGWEGSRFESSLFFWNRQDSVYRLTDQAVREYREEGGSGVPPNFESDFNSQKLEYLREYICEVGGLTIEKIKAMFRAYQIAPNNPLLDQITKAPKR